MKSENLKSLLEGLPENVQRYLVYRILGYTTTDIIDLLGVNDRYFANLRVTDDRFKDIEAIVLAYPDAYVHQANDERWKWEKADSILFLDKIISRAKVKAEEMNAGDVRLVLGAINTLRGLKRSERINANESGISDYDAKILENYKNMISEDE